MTEDGRTGTECSIEINSMVTPFYVPRTISGTTGREFVYEMKVQRPLNKMYAAIRCDGYETATRMFEVSPGLLRCAGVDLGRITLTRSH